MSKANQTLQEIVDSLDGDELCKYCIFKEDCPRGVMGWPNGPIYPPCADSCPENWFDIDVYQKERNFKNAI